IHLLSTRWTLITGKVPSNAASGPFGVSLGQPVPTHGGAPFFRVGSIDLTGIPICSNGQLTIRAAYVAAANAAKGEEDEAAGSQRLMPVATRQTRWGCRLSLQKQTLP